MQTTLKHQISKVTIVDRPCGTGKTSRLLKSFEQDKKYIVVVPLLSEVKRFIDSANVLFEEPIDEYLFNKTDSLRNLLIMGKNIVTTHSLYPNIVFMIRDGLMDDYHLIIDEVPQVVKPAKQLKKDSYENIYLNHYVTQDERTGKITPTKKWHESVNETDDTLSKSFYIEAKSGCLYNVDGTFFLWALPIEVLTHNLSVTIYTYLAKGSMLLAYLNKLNVRYSHDTDACLDLKFRAKAKRLIHIESIPAIEKTNLGAVAQLSMDKASKSVIASALNNPVYRGDLKGVPKGDIVVTSLKSNWYYQGKDKISKPRASGFSVNTGLLKSHWISNTTRGTNKYMHATHMIYLWNQNMNEYLRRWLDMNNIENTAHDAYATTELVQWIYRSQVRSGKPIKLYLPSPRMRKLLNLWLNAEDLKV